MNYISEESNRAFGNQLKNFVKKFKNNIVRWFYYRFTEI